MTYEQGYADALKAAAEVCNTTVILTHSADDVRFIKDKILALPIPDPPPYGLEEPHLISYGIDLESCTLLFKGEPHFFRRYVEEHFLLEEVNEQLCAKTAELQAKLEVAEPVAWMFQHEETGRTMCVDVVQVENGFEQNNPRLQKIAPLFTAPPQVEAAVEDFRRRAVEVCNKIVRVATIPESTTEAFSGYSRAMKHNEIKQEIESLPAFEEKGE